MFSIRNFVGVLGLVLIIFLIYFIFFRTASVPWEDSGRLVLAVKSVPEPGTGTTFGFGIDDVLLYKKNGGTEKISVLTRRVSLTPGSSDVELVLDTEVPIGEYVGLGLTIKSPELRNDWQENEVPGHISLIREDLHFNVPYRIEKDVTSTMILAFETLRAIHEMDAEKKYLPVVQIETRSNTTINDIGGKVQIEGGNILNSATFGMDFDGTMRHNFRAKKNPYVQNFPTEIQQTEVATSTSATTSDTVETQASSSVDEKLSEKATSSEEEL